MNTTRKILIIEDNDAFAKVLSDALHAHNKSYKVIRAHDGEDGVEKAIKEKPDLILLDLMLPKLQGEGCLRKIREHDGLARVPVFILSQLSSIEKIAEGVELGVKGYIIKAEMSLGSILEQIDQALNENPSK